MHDPRETVIHEAMTKHPSPSFVEQTDNFSIYTLLILLNYLCTKLETTDKGVNNRGIHHTVAIVVCYTPLIQRFSASHVVQQDGIHKKHKASKNNANPRRYMEGDSLRVTRMKLLPIDG